MPFMRMDPETWDEYVGEFGIKEAEEMGWIRPSGEFEYEAREGRFFPNELGPVAREMLKVLIAIGATHFRVRYDGGQDEGFAYSNLILFGEVARGVKDVLQEVGTEQLQARICAAAKERSSWGDAEQLYANTSPNEAAHYALEELAGGLAVKLLGGGFGTGDYELFGAFTADLVTGQLTDDPNAQKPDQVA